MSELSAKTRRALGLQRDPMPARMEVLRVIADNGPLRKVDIERISGCGDARANTEWLVEQMMVARTECASHVILFTATRSGLMRLQSGGDVVPPATRAPQPWAMVRDLAWPTMRAGADRAFDVPSAGIPT